MIRVLVVKTTDDQIRAFQVSGHAGYAESGQDIVCSAVSALTINTVNALEKLTDTVFEAEADPENGTITVNFTEDPDHDGRLLVNALILGLTTIEKENNGDYLHVEFREV